MILRWLGGIFQAIARGVRVRDADRERFGAELRRLDRTER
jgi:hypothetical protein